MGRTGQGNDAWTDMQILDVLDLMDVHGWTGTQVAERYGVSRSAIIGLRHRVLTDLRKSEIGAHPCRPENSDGGMPHGWWRHRAGKAA